MTLSGEVDYAIDMLVLHQLIHALKVADVHLDKLIVWLVFHVLEVGKVAGLCQFVEIDDVILRIFVDKKAYNMAPDKPSASRDDDASLHSCCYLVCYNLVGQNPNLQIYDFFLDWQNCLARIIHKRCFHDLEKLMPKDFGMVSSLNVFIRKSSVMPDT